jgi:hypothetical protein
LLFMPTTIQDGEVQLTGVLNLPAHVLLPNLVSFVPYGLVLPGFMPPFSPVRVGGLVLAILNCKAQFQSSSYRSACQTVFKN